MRYVDLYQGLKNSSLTVILVLLVISSLSACGKKGSLYLPAEPEPVVTTEAPVAALVADPDDSEESKKKPTEQ